MDGEMVITLKALGVKMRRDDGEPLDNPTSYRQLVGALKFEHHRYYSYCTYGQSISKCSDYSPHWGCHENSRH